MVRWGKGTERVGKESGTGDVSSRGIPWQVLEDDRKDPRQGELLIMQERKGTTTELRS